MSVAAFISIPVGFQASVYMLSIGYLSTGIAEIILGITGTKRSQNADLLDETKARASETASAPIPDIVRVVNSDARPVKERIPARTMRIAMTRIAARIPRITVELIPEAFAARASIVSQDTVNLIVMTPSL